MENKKNISKQINKEALITLILYGAYFIWWYYFAYIYSPVNVEDYKYILGLPEWFFYSCVLGLIFINILVYLSTKFLFKDFDFSEFENEDDLEVKGDNTDE